VRHVLVLSITLVTIAGIAFAQTTERRRYRIETRVPAGCTESFSEALLAKTKTIELVRSSEPAQASLLRVRVTKQGGPRSTFAGSLDIETDGAPPVRRELEGESCTEVLRGLALVAAVTIDPPSAPEAPDATDEAEAPAAEDGGGGDAAAYAIAPPSDAGPGAAPTADRGKIGLVVGGSGEVSALADDPTLLFGGYVAIATRRTGPELRLRFDGSLSSDVASRSGRASLSWLIGTAEICPLGLSLTTTLLLRPCIGVALGSLEATGSGAGLAASETHRLLWAAGRAGARLELDVGPIVFGAALGAAIPVSRAQLYFRAAPGTSTTEPVYRAPPIAAFGGIDVGVRFR
jgi:hypothetical protein